MSILPAKASNDCVLWYFPLLWYVGSSAPHRVDLISGAHESDLLAFALIISSTAKLKTTGIKVSVLLSTIVEDSTLYFLFIFASQFVFMMTLILGRVSTRFTFRTTAHDIYCMSIQESIQLLPAL